MSENSAKPRIHSVKPASGRTLIACLRAESRGASRAPVEAPGVDPFVDMAIFDEGGATAKGRAEFEAAIGLPALVEAKAPCWIGVDMSTTIDLTAVVAAFPDGDGGFIVLPHAFCPAANIQARADRDKVPYPRWAEQGFITPTPGKVIDPPSVESYIRGLCDRFDVREINFDEKFAQSVMGPLGESGLPVASMQQGRETRQFRLCPAREHDRADEPVWPGERLSCGVLP